MPKTWEPSSVNISVDVYNLPDFIEYEYQWEQNQLNMMSNYEDITCDDIQSHAIII